MRKNLKFDSGEKLYFVSDLHFHHFKDFILEPRGFKTVEEHDRVLIERWNAAVPKDGIVFFLGDFMLYSDSALEARRLLGELNFAEIFLLWGNHDSGIRQLYECSLPASDTYREIYPFTLKDGENRLITFLGNYQEISVERQHIVLNHFALRTWNHNGKGVWCLAGHSHGNDKDINPGGQIGKILDVGIENFGRPISFAHVKAIMDAKPIKTFDHHG